MIHFDEDSCEARARNTHADVDGTNELTPGPMNDEHRIGYRLTAEGGDVFTGAE